MRQAQVNFSRGEIGPQLHARFDVDSWAAGLAMARNVFVLKYGGVSKRPGTLLVSEVLDGTRDSRLIPFQFSISQTYALEMGHGYMSPCALGGRLIEDEQAVSAISNDMQAIVSIAYHGLSAGDYVYFQHVRGAMGDYLNGRSWRVMTVVDAGRFTINADLRTVPPFEGCDGGTVRSAPPVVPSPPAVPAPVTPDPAPDYYTGAAGDFAGWVFGGLGAIP